MNAPERLRIPDIQSMTDHRAIAIDRAGIRGLRHPISVAASRVASENFGSIHNHSAHATTERDERAA